ncbi:MAG: 50S ribosomal protein L12 [Nanoarchaeota archaeon]|nr:50S ribosomal protein L12 [Nanoarchaeota archaeon]
MNYVYGALLLHSAGKPIEEAALKAVIGATGEAANEAQIKALVSALDGVNIEEAIAKAAMPVAVAGPAVEAKAEKKEKAEDSEKKAESAAEGLGALFG